MTPAGSANAIRAEVTGISATRRFLRAILPALSLALVLAGVAWLNPRFASRGLALASPR